MLFSECRAFGIAAIARSRALDVDAVGLANAFDVENALLRGTVDMAGQAQEEFAAFVKPSVFSRKLSQQV